MAGVHDLIKNAPSDDVLRSELKQWEDSVYEALRLSGHLDDPAVKFGGTLPLHLLPAQTQTTLMGEYRQITRLNEALNALSDVPTDQTFGFLENQWGLDPKGTLNKRISNIWGGLHQVEGREGSLYGRFPGSDTNTLLGRLYNSLNLQLNSSNQARKTGMTAPGRDPLHHFSTGSIPKLEELQRPSQVDFAGKNVFLFDLETAGLRPGSIREFGYESFRVGPQGTMMPSSLQRETVPFRPVQGTRGSQVLDKSGKIVNTDELFPNTLHLPATAEGEDFIERIMPVLKKASEADLVVGHNTERFDISQIFQSLAGTKRYIKNKGGFRDEIDQLYGVIKSKSFDTLRAARQSPGLSDLTVSTHLKGTGATAYSIENLLLNTRLAKDIGIENLAAAMGYDAKTDLFTGGLHNSAVDALVDRHLMLGMADLRPVDILDSGITDDEGVLARKIIGNVQQGGAITPFTKIRDPSQVHPSVRALIGSHGTVNPIEHEVLMERKLQLGASQEAIQRAAEGLDPKGLLPGVGSFDRLIGRRRDAPWAKVYDETVKPLPHRFAAYQAGLAGANMPFAGLSYEERLFGTAISDITLRASGGKRAAIARESLLAKWDLFDPKAIDYVSRGSGKVTLPIQVLEHAKLLNRANDPALFGLSIVQPTQNRGRSINLTYSLRGGDKTSIIDALTDMSQSEERFAEIMGMTESDPKDITAAYNKLKAAISGTANAAGDLDEATSLIKQLNAPITKEYGITVGQLVDNTAVTEVANVIGAANNSEKLNDMNRLAYRLPFAEVRDNQLITGGAVIDRGLQRGSRASLGRNVAMALGINNPEKTTTGFAGINNNYYRATTARAMDAGTIPAGRAMKMNDFILDKALPNIHKVAAGAAIAGIGAYLYHRKRRADRYDIDFAYEGPNVGQSRYAAADVLRMRMESGYDGARRQVDPLATASLTDHLYNSSIGHTSMSWDKNSSIYGGVL